MKNQLGGVNKKKIKENIERLKKEGFSDEYANKGAKLDDTKIENMIELKKLGFDDEFAYNGGRYLKNEEIKYMIERKKELRSKLVTRI